MRVAIATGLCLVVHGGCDTVDGGAVELSWKLRLASSDSDDKFVDCRNTDTQPDGTVQVFEIAAMRLRWVNDDGTMGQRSWVCSDNHGVTGFELPAGHALLSVEPTCADGDADPSTYVAPAPELRAVDLGDTVTLGAIQIVVRESYCDEQPCACRVQ